jgi:hypothetical protein
MWSRCDAISLNRNGSLVCYLRRILKDEVNMDVNERLVALDRMQDASDAFYRSAVSIGNHPFIEFAGLMNEYITACRAAHRDGIDFTQCNVHNGQTLPLHPVMSDYINEKLECIFTGAKVLRATEAA